MRITQFGIPMGMVMVAADARGGAVLSDEPHGRIPW
jgi:hypothetical protein